MASAMTEPTRSSSRGSGAPGVSRVRAVDGRDQAKHVGEQPGVPALDLPYLHHGPVAQ